MVTTAVEAPNFPMKRGPLAPPEDYTQFQKQKGLVKITMPDGSWAWIVTRYNEVRAVLGDNRFTTVPSTPNYPMVAPARASLLMNEKPATLIRLDPPEHTRYRRMFNMEFMNKHMDAQRPYIKA